MYNFGILYIFKGNYKIGTQSCIILETGRTAASPFCAPARSTCLIYCCFSISDVIACDICSVELPDVQGLATHFKTGNSYPSSIHFFQLVWTLGKDITVLSEPNDVFILIC